jgi:hypothetical protein
MLVVRMISRAVPGSAALDGDELAAGFSEQAAADRVADTGGLGLG